ncbi:MAG: dihydroorotase [Planctomycetes bacterium]|nr:dihydroorotase [Planctomycetota bacterium]
MTDILIKGGRVIDPAGGLDRRADVLISDGKIAKVGRVPASQITRGCKLIDAVGKIVCPGLIDIHVHCREPGHEEEETIATAAGSAVAGGFTTIVAMPNTHPVIDNEAMVQYVIHQAENAGLARVLPAGAITKDRQGKELAELGSMLAAGAVAFTDDGDGLASSSVMQRALQYAGMFDAPILQHCQDPDLGGSGVMNSGAMAVRLGLPGIPAAAEEIMLQRDLALLARTGGRYHVQHVSTAGAVDMIRSAKKLGLHVTAEATPHHMLLTDAACQSYDPNYKVAPPLRSAGDVEAVRQGVADGTIDCLATDHAPHSKEEKELEFALAPSGLIALQCALGLFAKALIDTGLIDWPTLIARMTTGPAAVIRQPLASLAAGAVADVTIIDPQADYTVDVTGWLSKSRNCPYHNWPLHVRAVGTIVAGQVKFLL